MNRDIKSIEKVLKNPNSRNLLVEELIKDEYYEEMQPKPIELDEEEILE